MPKEPLSLAQDGLAEISMFVSMMEASAKQQYKFIRADFRTFRQAARAMPRQTELQHLRNRLAPEMAKLCAHYDKQMAVSSSLPSSPVSSKAAAKPLRPPPSRLMFKLPTFSSDTLQRKEFWNLLSSRIKYEAGLTDYEKICHLKGSVDRTSCLSQWQP